MNFSLLKVTFVPLILFVVYSCTSNVKESEYSLYKLKKDKNYKICLEDANDQINQKHNINLDRIDLLQTDDTMTDFYNIDNEIDIIKLSAKREKMVTQCIKRRSKK